MAFFVQTLSVGMANELSAAGFFLFKMGGKGDLNFMLNGQLWEAGTVQSFASSLQTSGVKVRYISNFFYSFGQVAEQANSWSYFLNLILIECTARDALNWLFLFEFPKGVCPKTSILVITYSGQWSQSVFIVYLSVPSLASATTNTAVADD